MSRPPHRIRRRAGCVVAGALLALSAAACSDDDGADADPAGASASATPDDDATPPVVTRATMGTVTGALATAPRTQLLGAITATVDAWIDAAFPAGPVAAVDDDAAFAVFTPRAATRARADAALLTNAGLPADVDSVALVDRRLAVDVLAVDGQAVGVTARVAVGMALSGAREHQERVVCTLSLTYSDGSWRVFGYDLDRGEVR